MRLPETKLDREHFADDIVELCETPNISNDDFRAAVASLLDDYLGPVKDGQSR